MRKNQYNALIMIVLLTIVFTSIGFSAFANVLGINGIIANVRPQMDFRIIRFNTLSTSDESSYSNYEDFTKDQVLATATLHSEDSYIIYGIKLCNLGNVIVGIKSIELDNNKLKYELLNYTIGDRVCDGNKCKLGIEKEIQIKISYKDGMYDENNIENNFNIKFTYENIYDVRYSNIKNSSSFANYAIHGVDYTVDLEEDNYKLKILMDGIYLSENIDYTYNNGILTIYNVTGHIIIRSIGSSIINGSFEEPTIGGSYANVKKDAMPGWHTTNLKNEFEVIRFGSIYTFPPHFKVPNPNIIDSQLPDGTQFAEINADEESTLYQNINTVVGEEYTWKINHRARSSRDVMAVIIGNKQDIEPLKLTRDSKDQFMELIQWHMLNIDDSLLNYFETQKATIYSSPFEVEGNYLYDSIDNFSYTMDEFHTEKWEVWIMTSPGYKWTEYQDTYTANSNNTTFALLSVESVSGNITTGNLVDKIEFLDINSNNYIGNNSFENTRVSTGSVYSFFKSANSSNPAENICWNTTATTKNIEVGASLTAYGIDKEVIVAHHAKDKLQVIELNANEPSTTYQHVLIERNKVYQWSLSHHGRDGIDYMGIIIGERQINEPQKLETWGKDQYMQIMEYIYNNSSTNNFFNIQNGTTTGMSNKITIYTPKFDESGSFEGNLDNNFSITETSTHTEEWSIWIFGTDNTNWQTYEADYLPKDTTLELTIALTNYRTSNQIKNPSYVPNSTVGNIIDAVKWKSIE